VFHVDNFGNLFPDDTAARGIKEHVRLRNTTIYRKQSDAESIIPTGNKLTHLVHHKKWGRRAPNDRQQECHHRARSLAATELRHKTRAFQEFVHVPNDVSNPGCDLDVESFLFDVHDECAGGIAIKQEIVKCSADLRFQIIEDSSFRFFQRFATPVHVASAGLSHCLRQFRSGNTLLFSAQLSLELFIVFAVRNPNAFFFDLQLHLQCFDLSLELVASLNIAIDQLHHHSCVSLHESTRG